METTNIDVQLIEKKDSDFLVFRFDEDLEIDLNNSDQSQLRTIFYKIVQYLFESKIEFTLTYPDYNKQIYIEVAQDYLDQLEVELDSIYEKLPNLE
ncbi:MAG: hypothetical protein A2Y19_00480 [Firmicutes bacterium GWE2_51_13]|nr:MAG: hypothetical protein A2Y19_00480 [Firmicutes bacterium GWE2_51_13]